MADDFSQSLTPPVSPFAADSLCELIAARPPCFCCSETKEDPTGALSTEGYTAQGSLKRYSHCQLTIITEKHFPTWRSTVFTLRILSQRNCANENCWQQHLWIIRSNWVIFLETHIAVDFFQRSVLDAFSTTTEIPVTSIVMGWQQMSQWQNNLSK